MEIKHIDNIGDNTIENFLKDVIDENSNVNIVTPRFSIYALHAIQKAICKSKSFNVLLSQQYFEKPDTGFLRRFELAEKQEKVLGNQYELKLRNQLNTSFIAKQTASIIKNHITFKKLNPEKYSYKQLFIENEKDSLKSAMIPNDFELTGDGLGLTKSNRWNDTPVMMGNTDMVKAMLTNFNMIWNHETEAIDANKEVLKQLENIYKENSPEWIYLVSLYHIFHQQLDELDEENIIKEGSDFKDSIVWNMLYEFQKDGVVGLINKLEKYNGAILADSVGLGKTFSALAVIKYYESRNHRVLVLAPKRLRENWTIYTQNDKRNELNEDRFGYDVLNHTDLSRYKGKSGDLDLQTVRWDAYDLVVIDESHNFRNNEPSKSDNPTRYQRLMNDVIKSGSKTKVLMLSATPVNNRMTDMKNQIAFITEENTRHLQNYGVEDIDLELRKAQQVFNEWSKLESDQRSTGNFLKQVNAGYFKILDLLTIARSRKHIEKYYDASEIGTFPTRLKPLTLKPDIDINGEFIEIKKVNQRISELTLSVYTPIHYIKPEMRGKYAELYDQEVKGGATRFTQTDRETALTGLIRSNLLKRLESSIDSFRLTTGRVLEKIESYIELIDKNSVSSRALLSLNDIGTDDEDFELFEDENVIGGKTKVLLGDMDLRKWRDDLAFDLKILKEIHYSAYQVEPNKDGKLVKLKQLIQEKIKSPLNPGNKKIIIFTAFADTANYLYDNLAENILEKYGLHSAIVTGGGNQKTTLKSVKVSDMNDILIHFSPRSKHREKIFPEVTDEIDILIATDTLSEGQNLQDCDYLINYDIHWNPVRVIQRFGRIDRIGSINKQIQLVNFWPNMELDEYINLENRVRSRMVMLNVSATGEEDLLNQKNNEMNDLSYRKNQLQQLQEEVTDLEDINGAISITDITYTDYKADLTNALKTHEKELLEAPKGMYAITKQSLLEEAEPGVIFVLKQKDLEIETKNTSLLPYILIYMRMDGSVKVNHTSAKDVLHYFKMLTQNQTEVFQDIVDSFNKETKDGSNMTEYSLLLTKALEAIKGKREETGRMSLFTPGGTHLTTSQEEISLEEVELISFLIIRES